MCVPKISVGSFYGLPQTFHISTTAQRFCPLLAILPCGTSLPRTHTKVFDLVLQYLSGDEEHGIDSALITSLHPTPNIVLFAQTWALAARMNIPYLQDHLIQKMYDIYKSLIEKLYDGNDTDTSSSSTSSIEPSPPATMIPPRQIVRAFLHLDRSVRPDSHAEKFLICFIAGLVPDARVLEQQMQRMTRLDERIREKIVAEARLKSLDGGNGDVVRRFLVHGRREVLRYPPLEIEFPAASATVTAKARAFGSGGIAGASAAAYRGIGFVTATASAISNGTNGFASATATATIGGFHGEACCCDGGCGGGLYCPPDEPEPPAGPNDQDPTPPRPPPSQPPGDSSDGSSSHASPAIPLGLPQPPPPSYRSENVNLPSQLFPPENVNIIGPTLPFRPQSPVSHRPPAPVYQLPSPRVRSGRRGGEQQDAAGLDHAYPHNTEQEIQGMHPVATPPRDSTSPPDTHLGDPLRLNPISQQYHHIDILQPVDRILVNADAIRHLPTRFVRGEGNRARYTDIKTAESMGRGDDHTKYGNRHVDRKEEKSRRNRDGKKSKGKGRGGVRRFVENMCWK
ncbi:unnamed protein product [Periconia digitata]|uniref:Uncharacterized protein n=1 Tax=Periconia digitata TaxID=1303443 RepID=A0A9W4XVF7_9PLEO|nr:unnamed protein product [Periconia digitata]